MLAGAQKPNEKGAVGRNREQYFHVRFQYRIHHLADYAVRNQDMGAARHFIKSLEYAFDHQNNDGSFELHIPDDLKFGKKPDRGDLASGVAFFLASAGSGVLSLKQSDWLHSSDEAKSLRVRLEKLNDGLRKAIGFLAGEQKILRHYDAKAPNRLLYDALAFQANGIYFQNPKLLKIADRFKKLALEQQNETGFFIEGGGYDTSYNGVAVALGYRLLLFKPNDSTLRNALEKAVRWQGSRIRDTGEINSEGNSRVFPGGESFLGREKRIDVSHTVEGFALAFAVTGNDRYLHFAQKIVEFYNHKAKKANP